MRGEKLFKWGIRGIDGISVIFFLLITVCILFDNKSTCEKYLEWFNKCFKTIQEQEAEKEELSKKMNMYKKIFKAREDLKKINENKEKNNNSKKKNKKKK